MNKKAIKKSFTVSFIILLVILILGLFIIRALDEPHGIEGYVFMSNGITQVPNGIPITINDTNSTDFIITQTSGPPVATGFYSGIINGSNNDTTIITAWNATNYGQTVVFLLNLSQSPATYANLSLNLTRPSETNVTIIDPNDRDSKNLNLPFYVTVNISIIGGQNGTNCNATLSISNTSVFVLGSAENNTHLLGNITLGSSVISQWNVTSIAQGKSNFIFTAICLSDGLNFDNSSRDILYNITAQYVPTPEPHGVEGYVFMYGKVTQAPIGVNVSINDSSTNDYVTTQTSGPPIATGFFSATINGSSGDTIIVRAWNATTYGEESATLLDISQSPATYVNVTLNITRPSETNVTIVYPEDFEEKLANVSFFVYVNITIIGGQDGLNCSATINFSNTSLILLGSGENLTHQLGDVLFGNTINTTWNLTGIAEGISNVTVTAQCDSDGLNFDGLDRDTIVNLTFKINKVPVISNVVCENPIILNPGTMKKIICNATVSDEDNISDIKFFNATFFDIDYNSSANDDNNYHYTNNSCFNVSATEESINYTCSFNVWYYANNATWVFNISAMDYGNLTGNGSTTTNINELYAINVSPLVIDFGELQPLNTSELDVEASINNFGNKDINITLEGFGWTEGDNLSMSCGFGNISIYYEKYSILNGTSFTDMINMTSNPVQIANFTLFQRINDTDLGIDTNSTYWKLYVPPAVAGMCNGTIIFTAIPN